MPATLLSEGNTGVRKFTAKAKFLQPLDKVDNSCVISTILQVVYLGEGSFECSR